MSLKKWWENGSWEKNPTHIKPIPQLKISWKNKSNGANDVKDGACEFIYGPKEKLGKHIKNRSGHGF
jgi:hypothetical protein